MKSLLKLLLLFVLVFGVVFEADAQKKKKKKKKGKKEKTSKADKKKQKADEKKWKARLKKMTPTQYKNLMDEYYSLKDRVSTAEEEAINCQNSLSEKDAMIGKYQTDIAKISKEAKANNQGGGRASVKGVTFRVQVGSYSQIDLSQHADQENFSVEQAEGAQKFTIGLFKNYREADSLKKYLVQMGVKDAWVVSYRDGNRVDMKEVLNEAADTTAAN